MAAGGKAQEAACCGREVAIFRVVHENAKISRFRMLVGELCGHMEVVSALGRAPHI